LNKPKVGFTLLRSYGPPIDTGMRSIYEYVLDRLQMTKGHWPQVAEETGISRRTIEKIARQEVQDPGVKTVEKLAQYFREQDAAKRRARRTVLNGEHP